MADAEGAAPVDPPAEKQPARMKRKECERCRWGHAALLHA